MKVFFFYRAVAAGTAKASLEYRIHRQKLEQKKKKKRTFITFEQSDSEDLYQSQNRQCNSL